MYWQNNLLDKKMSHIFIIKIAKNLNNLAIKWDVRVTAAQFTPYSDLE